MDRSFCALYVDGMAQCRSFAEGFGSLLMILVSVALFVLAMIVAVRLFYLVFQGASYQYARDRARKAERYASELHDTSVYSISQINSRLDRIEKARRHVEVDPKGVPTKGRVPRRRPPA